MRGNNLRLQEVIQENACAGKLEILYYTPYFRETLKDAIGFSPEVAEDLCEVTLDHARFPHADAVLFHLPNMAMESIPPTKTPGQIWIGMSMESDANYPLQCNPEFMRHFDLRMNFRRDCDVPLLYFDSGLSASFAEGTGRENFCAEGLLTSLPTTLL